MAGGNIPGKIKPYIVGAARQYGIRASDLAGLLDVESTLGSDRSTSSAGAVGIAQFLPSTARSIGVNPYNDRSAIFGAAKYLSQLGYGKDRLRALGAYNGGPGNPVYSYARQVISEGNRLSRQLAGAQPSGGSGAPAQPGQSVTRTVTTSPGVDNSGTRKALMYQYLSQPQAQPFNAKNLSPGRLPGLNNAQPLGVVSGPDPAQYLAKAASGTSSLLNLAGGLQQAQDVAPTTKTVVQRSQAPQQQGQQGPYWSFPVQGHYTENRTDRGVDFQTTPHTPLVAVGSGKIVSTQGNFPGGSIVLQLDHPINGYRYVYYGHLSDAGKRVRPGQRVNAGQIIARTVPRPPDAENLPGWTEIGLTNSSAGSIEAPHDDTHNTHSGNTFHQFLYGNFPGKVQRRPIIG